MPDNFYYKYVKTPFDFLIGFIAVIFIVPIIAVVGILMIFIDPGPIFFKQYRMGKHCKPFKLIKFRTMSVQADNNGPLITQAGDKRISSLGKILRQYKIDELPQFINVLKGDMSIVGPRPEVEKYTTLFTQDYKFILSIKPGITDYAALEYRDEESVLKKYTDLHQGYIDEVLPQKIQLYKYYIANISFLTDINIIFRTFRSIFS